MCEQKNYLLASMKMQGYTFCFFCFVLFHIYPVK